MIALEDECRRIEAAATPSDSLEELRNLCERNDLDLKQHIVTFEQEVLRQQAALQNTLTRAEEAFGIANNLNATYMGLIAQEVQSQSGAQVQQALQTLQQEAAGVRHDVETLRNYTGIHGVTLQDRLTNLGQWQNMTTDDFNNFKQYVNQRIEELGQAGSRTGGGAGSSGFQ